MENFNGIRYRLANNWYSLIDVEQIKQKPINYLEIGTFYGANLLSVAESYALHPKSKLYCVDPWIDYGDYPEYKDKQTDIYSQFLKNIELCPYKSKINIHRGFSNDIIPTLDDEMFDIIYIDGNHEPEYVLEDAVLSFRKLKKDGIMIFDDYGWGGPELTQKGIDAFIHTYSKMIEIIGMRDCQVFLRKIKNHSS